MEAIATPNVLAAFRTYSGCTTVPGAPIEVKGGSGSAGSHWERSVF